MALTIFPADAAPLTSTTESPVIVATLLLLQQAATPSSPSGGYWQQEVAYEIDARLDEPSGVLSGTERIRYTNRSPDTLTTFALHLYLNAFRPGSRWSDADSVEGRRRFNDLKDPDFAFNHVRNVRIMGSAVRPIYPFAPDSTVVRFALPQPLLPGESMTAEMAWDARPSTLPRRQGRQGRRFDFAQWYPKVVVYDRLGWQEHPLYPAGEFYGEFASFQVDLDLPEDQVIGATGVPVCGDPGWARANRSQGQPVEYQRNYYGTRTPASACEGAERGRKRIRWYAEDVHHFAFSLNPEYRYEGGRYEDVAIHVLYQPGDEESWGNGIAVERTQVALAWLDQLFGKYAWPQITNLHRIEGGGTEFPMMMMNGSAHQGLILHELGHIYTMGILANNEWREGWLDEGFTSFQTGWFLELLTRQSDYADLEEFILTLELDKYSEPVSLVSEAYRDFSTYGAMIYNKAAIFFFQLRYIVGDEVMGRILRTFYHRWKLKHVDEAAFRSVAEEVSNQDLSTFFAQWLHATVLYDYAIGKVRTAAKRGGGAAGQGYVTRVEVLRKEEGRIPVEVAVIAERDTGIVRAAGLAEREWVEVETRSKPRLVVLDPRVQTHDWNMLNNRKRLGWFNPTSLFPPPGTDFYFHPYFSTRHRRDRLTVGLQPTLWYNDAGGITIGIRSRDDYLGRFEQNQALIAQSTGWASDDEVEDTDFFLRARNPVFLRAPNTSQTFDAFNIEGRYGLTAALDWSRREHQTFGPTWSRSAKLQWVAPDDFRYLDPGLYEDVGTVEVSVGGGVATRSGKWELSLQTSTGGGLQYNRQGLDVTGRPELDPFYFRGLAEGIARRPLGSGLQLAARLFLGVAGGEDEAAKQRQIYFQGADPLQQLYNPFLRSRGALLVGEDFNYHAAGGAGVRGIDSRISTASIVALNLELEQSILRRPTAKLFRGVALAAFTDLSHAIGGSAQPLTGDRIRFLADAGLGLRARHRIGETEFSTRFDFPLYVSRPELAQDRDAGDEELEFRWTFSFEEAF
ncbi:MAG TPA: M1 family metallopeptidase [Gemmatimonadales bacterium]|nr:M1 family metallopeptidase [Gemmatimonadales bacterium]